MTAISVWPAIFNLQPLISPIMPTFCSLLTHHSYLSDPNLSTVCFAIIATLSHQPSIKKKISRSSCCPLGDCIVPLTCWLSNFRSLYCCFFLRSASWEGSYLFATLVSVIFSSWHSKHRLSCEIPLTGLSGVMHFVYLP